ncbi:MAG: OmpA family protein [Alphaproteobacteria bacterium]|nr:OmpA family protein [Alphaproteobacteria bacterium]
MKLRFVLVVLIMGFLTACAAAPTEEPAPAPAPAAVEETVVEEVGELVAVVLRDDRAVGVDIDGNPVDATLTEMLRVMPDRVFFDYDRFNFQSDEARETIDIYAALLRQNPDVTMVVEGHCDERGTREYNLALGERRANTIYSRIITRNVQSERLRKVSYGKERPEVIGSDEESWRENRRGVILLFNY